MSIWSGKKRWVGFSFLAIGIFTVGISLAVIATAVLAGSGERNAQFPYAFQNGTGGGVKLF